MENDFFKYICSLAPEGETALIVKQIDYDGATGRVTITFHPDGIKTIAIENRPQLNEAAS